MADVLITVYQNRTSYLTVVIKTKSGGYVQIAATDVVRVKIGRGNDTPTLDLDSAAASSNGSTVTVDEYGDGTATHNSITVRIAAADLANLLGMYDLEVSLVDDSDSDEPKHAISGRFAVLQSQAGDAGLT